MKRGETWSSVVASGNWQRDAAELPENGKESELEMENPAKKAKEGREQRGRREKEITKKINVKS